MKNIYALIMFLEKISFEFDKKQCCMPANCETLLAFKS